MCSVCMHSTCTFNCISAFDIWVSWEEKAYNKGKTVSSCQAGIKRHCKVLRNKHPGNRRISAVSLIVVVSSVSRDRSEDTRTVLKSFLEGRT